MRRWLAKGLAAVLLAIVGLVVTSGSAAADSNNCVAPEIPDLAGAGLQGRIDDRPKAGGGGDTLYEQYGWSGLSWHTCDLGEDGWVSMPDAAKNPGAWIDTSVGSMFMGGAGTIASFMTQLNEWVMDPGGLLQPIDGALTSIAKAVTGAVWAPWAGVLVVGAACMIAWWARSGNPRRAFASVGAILMAALAVSALGQTWQVSTGDRRENGSEVTVGKPGAVALGQFFDTAATDVIGEVSKQITGSSDPNVAYGAMLYDDILVPLWIEGAVGRGAGNVREDGTLANTIYRTNTASWAEQEAGVNAQMYKDKYVEVAKMLDGKADGTDKIQANDARYNQMRGVSGGRAGIGLEAFVTMLVIAIVRVPASILLLMGLIVVRFVVMFIPIWALFAIIEKTRPTAVTAGKMVLAAVYNAAVFGVFGVVYTAIVAAIIKSGSPPGYTFSKLVIILALTLVVWVVTKPFRSVTVPATGDVLGHAGNAGAQGMSMLKGFGAMFLANRLANRGTGGGGRKTAGSPIPEPTSEKQGEPQETLQEDRSTHTAVQLPTFQRKQQKLVYVKRSEVPPAEEPAALPAPPRRELPPGPDPEAATVPQPGPQLPPMPKTQELPKPASPVPVPKVEPITMEVPLDYEVIEPTRILEPVTPNVRQPEPLELNVPVVTVMEQNESGEWTQQQFREWRPPTQHQEQPWQDRSQWREEQPIYRPTPRPRPMPEPEPEPEPAMSGPRSEWRNEGSLT